jgi:cytochrome c
MKFRIIKITSIVSFIFLAASCGNNNGKANANSEDISSIEIFKGTNCATCHKVNELLVGPSFTNIAARYPNAADSTLERLTAEVVNGSVGHWGAVPMPPNPTVPKENVKGMVKYILQIKNK